MSHLQLFPVIVSWLWVSAENQPDAGVKLISCMPQCEIICAPTGQSWFGGPTKTLVILDR